MMDNQAIMDLATDINRAISIRVSEERKRAEAYKRKIQKTFAEDICRTNEYFYPKPICKNQPPENTNLMNACLTCPLKNTCKLLFVEGN